LSLINHEWQDLSNKLKRLKLLIRVKLFATLAQNIKDIQPGVPFVVEIPDGSTLPDLLKQLRVAEKEVKLLFVNGRLRSNEYQLKNDDDVGIFPPIGGG
jgi:sulfur-carrier protein